MQELQQKREPISVRIDTDVTALGRSLARTKFGNEDKLGQLVEEAILFYSAHHEDEVRAAALLKTTEEILLRRVGNSFDCMFKDLVTREKQMVDRIAGLNAITSYESCLTELMLKDLFVRDGETKARYEELRGLASKRMKDRFEKYGAEQLAELHEKVAELESSKELLRNKAKELVVGKEKQIEDLKITLSKVGHDVDRMQESCNKLNSLVTWYENRDRKIPAIKEEYSSLLKKLTYEEAAEIYQEQNPKPVP